jgi:hypothetical protein
MNRATGRIVTPPAVTAQPNELQTTFEPSCQFPNNKRWVRAGIIAKTEENRTYDGANAPQYPDH